MNKLALLTETFRADSVHSHVGFCWGKETKAKRNIVGSTHHDHVQYDVRGGGGVSLSLGEYALALP